MSTCRQDDNPLDTIEEEIKELDRRLAQRTWKKTK